MPADTRASAPSCSSSSAVEVIVSPDEPDARAMFARVAATAAGARLSRGAARVIWLPADPASRPGPRLPDAYAALVAERERVTVSGRADVGLVAVLLVALAGGLLLGGPGASPGQAVAVLTGHGSPDTTAAVLGVRLPRLVLALAVGAALALAGAALQSLLANPLADPFLLGISGGGAAAATLAFATLPAVAIGLVPAAAMFGAAASTGLVWWMARGPLGPSPTRMLLAGVAVNAATSATILTILALAPSPRLAGALAITMGSFAAATPEAVWWLAPYLARAARRAPSPRARPRPARHSARSRPRVSASRWPRCAAASSSLPRPCAAAPSRSPA